MCNNGIVTRTGGQRTRWDWDGGAGMRICLVMRPSYNRKCRALFLSSKLLTRDGLSKVLFDLSWEQVERV